MRRRFVWRWAAFHLAFEQQLRTVCGLPLGATVPFRPAAMANLLGELWYESVEGEGGKGHGAYREPDWSLLHAVPGLRLHLYGKHHARPGRKMGHFVVTGDDAEAVLECALQARATIGIRDERESSQERQRGKAALPPRTPFVRGDC